MESQVLSYYAVSTLPPCKSPLQETKFYLLSTGQLSFAQFPFLHSSADAVRRLLLFREEMERQKGEKTCPNHTAKEHSSQILWRAVQFQDDMPPFTTRRSE